MLNKKDYSKLTLEELLKEEKKIKKQDTFSSALIGFLFGVMVYGTVKDGFGFIHIVFPILLISGIYKNSQNLKDNLKQIQTEITERNTEQPAK